MQLAVAEKGLLVLDVIKGTAITPHTTIQTIHLRYPLSNGLTINSKKISEVLGPVK
jgi:hypothetical protein